MNKIKSTIYLVGRTVKMFGIKHGPAIALGVGIAAIPTAVILSSFASLKAKKIVEDAEWELDDIENTSRVEGEDKETGDIVCEEYTPEAKERDKARVMAKTALKLTTVYLPTAATTAVAISGILVYTKIIKQRLLIATTAYAALDTAFKNYRERVVEKYGKEIDHQLRYGIKKDLIQTTKIDENGNEVPVTKEVETSESAENGYCDLTRIFSKETSPMWWPEGDYNEMTLRGVENFYTRKLRVDGFVIMNDVLEAMGLKREAIGTVYGWVYDATKKDNKIDLSLQRIGTSDYLVDFSEIDYILDKIPTKLEHIANVSGKELVDVEE